MTFCSQCGNKIQGDSRFCVSCGASVNASKISKSASTNCNHADNFTFKSTYNHWVIMAIKKKWIIMGCFIIAVTIFLFAFINHGELNGTFVSEFDTFIHTETRSQPQNNGHEIMRFNGNRFTHTFYAVYGSFGGRDARARGASAQHVRGAFANNRSWVQHDVYRFTVTGTFSISGDRIEFVFSNGDVSVHRFEQTDNTILVDRTRYLRQ